MTSTWDRARAVADAVLYEGYLLYPYRGTSTKNQSRWQFGVLGPPGAADAGVGEDDTLSAEFLVDGAQAINLVVRFLQLQRRQVQRKIQGGFESVHELTTGAESWLTWDEAIECETSFGPVTFDAESLTLPVLAPAGTEVEPVGGGRLIRESREVCGALTMSSRPDGGLRRVTLRVSNIGAIAAGKDDSIARSMIGTHVIAEVVGGQFV
jgi:hypothetical protein